MFIVFLQKTIIFVPRRKNKNLYKMGKDSHAVSHNSLAFGCTVKGEINVDNDIRIDGTVVGNIDCKGKVIVGPTGNINGNIICANAEIIGSMQGNLKVNDTLTIQATGKVNGDIETATLVIEPKAIFCGTCAMGAKAVKSDKEKK